MTAIGGLTYAHIPGKGKSILFIHGLWAGAWVFKNWMNIASSKGYDVYAVNLSRHLNNQPILKSPSLSDYVDDVKDFILHTIKRETVIIGHSLGGLVAQKITQLGLVPKAVFVTTAPPSSILFRGGLLWTFIRWQYLSKILAGKPFKLSFNDMLKLGLNRVENPLEMYDKFVPDSGRIIRDMALLKEHTNNFMPVETMVLSGTEDWMIDPGVQRAVARKYGSVFVSCSGGHLLMMEQNWDRPLQEIIDFIS